MTRDSVTWTPLIVRALTRGSHRFNETARERLPGRRTVVEFDFTGPRGRRVWLLLEPREVSVCVTPPRFDSDLIVQSDLELFYRVWLGHIEFGAALRCGSVVVNGPPVLAKQLPQWFMWSPMARFVREPRQGLPQGSGLADHGS